MKKKEDNKDKIRKLFKKFERGTDGLKKEDFIKYDKSGNRIGLHVPIHHTFGHSASFPTRENIEEIINTYNKEKNKPIQRKEVNRLETKDIDKPDIKLTESVKELSKPKVNKKFNILMYPNDKRYHKDEENNSGEFRLVDDEIEGNDTINRSSQIYKTLDRNKTERDHTTKNKYENVIVDKEEHVLSYLKSKNKDPYNVKPLPYGIKRKTNDITVNSIINPMDIGKINIKKKKYESGVNQVANSTNSMAVERRLHQQNGTWGALSSIPLVGGVMSNSLNYLQGKGKSEYARNESIADMKMDRLSGHAQKLQEGFRTQGMRNSITNTGFGNQDTNDLYANMNNKAKHGKQHVGDSIGRDKALIEVEKDELIFRPTRNGYKLVADLVGGKTHEQGGEPIVAKEGDVIFPGKQRKQVSSLIDSKGNVADLNTFEALRAKLPKDKPSDVRKGQIQAKATGGRIEGTGMDVREAFRQGCKSKKYEKGTKQVKKPKPSDPIEKNYRMGASRRIDKKYEKEVNELIDLIRINKEYPHLRKAYELKLKELVNKKRKEFSEFYNERYSNKDTEDKQESIKKEVDNIKSKTLKKPEDSKELNVDRNYNKIISSFEKYKSNIKPVEESVSEENTKPATPLILSLSFASKPRYSELHTRGVERGGVQLEPTNAERDIYNPKDSTGKRSTRGEIEAGDYDEYKVNKVKELKDKGVDMSEYEGNNDIETFYNLYHNRKVNKPKDHIKADDQLKKALIDEDRENQSNYKPSFIKRQEPANKVSKLIPSISQELPEIGEQKPMSTNLQRLGRNLGEKLIEKGPKEKKEKEYSKGTSSVKHGIEHEQKEMKNVSAIQRKLNILKGMHKGVPKAEQGMYGVSGVGANQQGSLQANAKPIRDTPMMEGIQPMNANLQPNILPHTTRPQYTQRQDVQMPLGNITPTMPTLDEPKGAGTPNPAKGILGQFKNKGFRGLAVGNWDSAGFNLAVGQSRARADGYTDKYTATKGGSNTNQYEKGSKKLVVRKYGWGTGFVEANKGEENRKKKEDRDDYYLKNYSLSDINNFYKTVDLSDKVIDRNLKLREKLEKKRNGSSGLRRYESGVGRFDMYDANKNYGGNPKVTSGDWAAAEKEDGIYMDNDDRAFTKKLLEEQRVTQDPTNIYRQMRVIKNWEYKGKKGWDAYKQHIKDDFGVDMPYKDYREFVANYHTGYNNPDFALSASRIKYDDKQGDGRYVKLKTANKTGAFQWEPEQPRINVTNTSTNYQPAGPATTATGPAVSSKDVVPVHNTVNTESVKDRPIPTTVKDPTRINFGGERGASLPTDSSGDNIGGLMGGNINSDRRIRRNKAISAGDNRNKIKGGGGDSMEIEGGGGRGASAPSNSSGDNIGGAGAMIPFTKKNGEVGFKAVKGGKIKDDRRIIGNRANASGTNANKIKLGPSGPQDPNTMSPAQLRAANAGVDQAMLGANADARAKEEEARQGNQASQKQLKTIEEQYAALQGKEKDDYDKFYTEEEARRKSQYDRDKEELRTKMKAGANYNDAQFEANHPAYTPMTKGAFMPGSITGVQNTQNALNSASVGNTPAMTGSPSGSAATWQSPAELKRAMMAGTQGGGGQGNSYVGVTPPYGSAGGQGNSYIAPEKKENNVNQVSNPVAVGGNNENLEDNSKYKSGKVIMRGKWTPEKAKVMEAVIQANSDNYQANQTMKRDRDLSRRETAEARYKRDAEVAKAYNSQAPVIQGSSNVRVNSDNTNEEFRRGSRKLVVRKYEMGSRKLRKAAERYADAQLKDPVYRRGRVYDTDGKLMGSEDEEDPRLPGIKYDDFYRVDENGKMVKADKPADYDAVNEYTRLQEKRMREPLSEKEQKRIAKERAKNIERQRIERAGRVETENGDSNDPSNTPANTLSSPTNPANNLTSPASSNDNGNTGSSVGGEGNSNVTPLRDKINNLSQTMGGFAGGGKNGNTKDKSKYKGLKTVIDTRAADRQEHRLEKRRLKNERIKAEKETKPQSMDFKTPRWKETREKYDPAVSPDDVIANKTNLYRNNYQDLSAAQRQQTHSLMSGGGFDSANQIANKVNKNEALDRINTAEAGRLDQVNQSNTAILNNEKMTNFGAMNEALEAQAKNKGVADSMNYSALLRNNQRMNDKPMKDLNLNMGRMQYAMAGPMMAMQMENQRLANEYMKNGFKSTGGSSPDLNPVNPPAKTSSGEGAGFNPNPPALNANNLGNTMGPNPTNANVAPTEIDPKNFLQQTGFIKRKGTRKLKISKKK